MLDKVEGFLKNLISLLQLARIYSLAHPKSIDAINRTYEGLFSIFDDREEFTIGLIGEEIVFEKEIFFALSKISQPFIKNLKEKEIEKIIFRKGARKEELVEFIKFLLLPKEDIKKDIQIQEYLIRQGIKNIYVSKIKVSSSHSKDYESNIEEAAVDYISQYDDSLEKISKAVNVILSGEVLDYLDLKYTITNVIESLILGSPELLKLTTLKKHDITTFVHLLDVAILSIYFSSKIGFPNDDVLDIGIAALFHDIGKIYISRKVIGKPDKLTEEEFAIMKSHTTRGAEILLKYAPSLGMLPVVVAFEHHLRYDLKGYPKSYFTKKMHTASLIVSLCDVYDALSERRSYKRSYPPDMIYNLMLKEKGAAFEPQLLEDLFKVLGVWPLGTIVSLTDKRIAIVRQQNEDDIFSPKVEVISPADKKEYIDLKSKKDELKIEYSLNPLAEGKEYIRLT